MDNRTTVRAVQQNQVIPSALNGSVSGSMKITGNIMQTILKGLSAYEVAVENGFVGTEAEWLESLVGDPPKVEVVEDTKDSFVLSFTSGEDVLITPNLKPVLVKGVDYLTPEDVAELTDEVAQSVEVDMEDTFQKKGEYIEAEVMTVEELAELLK